MVRHHGHRPEVRQHRQVSLEQRQVRPPPGLLRLPGGRRRLLLLWGLPPRRQSRSDVGLLMWGREKVGRERGLDVVRRAVVPLHRRRPLVLELRLRLMPPPLPAPPLQRLLARVLIYRTQSVFKVVLQKSFQHKSFNLFFI